MSEIKLHCIICTAAIPEKRIAQRSNTCGKECKKKLKALFKMLALQRKCRHCNKPSSPAERAEFSKWRRERAKEARAETKHATAAA